MGQLFPIRNRPELSRCHVVPIILWHNVTGYSCYTLIFYSYNGSIGPLSLKPDVVCYVEYACSEVYACTEELGPVECEGI